MGSPDNNSLDSRVRQDNNEVLHFMTAAASVLNKHDLLSSREADNLRITVNGIQSHADSRRTPVISQFVQQNSEFLAILSARFGEQGLAQNLGRLSQWKLAANLRHLTSELGTGLLERAKLFFNKEIPVCVDGAIERNVLYSSILIDTAEVIGRSVAMLDQAIEELSLMLPHAMAERGSGERNLDEEICQAAGFRGVQRNFFGHICEQQSRHLVGCAVSHIGAAAIALATHIASEAEWELLTRLQIIAGSLRAECQRFSDIQPSSSARLLDWEIRRHSLLTIGWEISNNIIELRQNLSEFLTAVGHRAKRSDITRATTRHIQFSLIKKGTGALDAGRAAQDFTDYLVRHGVDPLAVIPGELRKIHGNLGPDALEVLQAELRGASAREDLVAEKARALSRADKLVDVFQRVLQAAGNIALIMALFVCGSCGLKTAPKASLLDFRPEVPFRGTGFTPNSEPRGASPAQQPDDGGIETHEE